jgi:hypothetical protein
VASDESYGMKLEFIVTETPIIVFTCRAPSEELRIFDCWTILKILGELRLATLAEAQARTDKVRNDIVCEEELAMRTCDRHAHRGEGRGGIRWLRVLSEVRGNAFLNRPQQAA